MISDTSSCTGGALVSVRCRKRGLGLLAGAGASGDITASVLERRLPAGPTARACSDAVMDWSALDETVCERGRRLVLLAREADEARALPAGEAAGDT